MYFMLFGEVDGESLTSQGHGDTRFNGLGGILQVKLQSFCKALSTVLRIRCRSIANRFRSSPLLRLSFVAGASEYRRGSQLRLRVVPGQIE